ncbi:glutamine amidotransferase [Agrobacterium larrymoorei]|uniref:type 1 glutamine amidotransferase family protein n=1 Tax=Agrobacterium larrymoorei TaxID=160699 RepID=UPI001573A911|nr:type 1 glutamine amidotransferase family protein [Agrobacterium larrymoorei]NTJ41626.1 glutamine amidotransferase [Agrobacterium larrymoorei]
MASIALALTEDFADWEPALITSVARGYLGVEIVTASPDGKPVTSMGGFRIMPDMAYDALDPDRFDALVIPGGLSWEKGRAPDFTDIVHRFRAGNRVVAGICAASSALAATGVLNHVAHTGNALESHRKHEAYQGAEHYRDQPQAVSDKGIITARGSSPVTFTAEILKALDLWSPEAESEIAAFSAEHR